MKMKIFGDDTYEVIMGSMAQAGKYYHNFIGVNHMFLSLFSFLSNAYSPFLPLLSAAVNY